MLIGVAERGVVVARRGGRRLAGGLAAGTALGAGLFRLIFGGRLFTFFHEGGDALPMGRVITETWSR